LCSSDLNEPGLTQLQELCHKVEQAFPESLRVAMRLIEKRPTEVDAVADYGEPGHEPFARLVLKAINFKRQQARPDTRPYAFEELPELAKFTSGGAADWDRFRVRLRQGTAELVYARLGGGWDGYGSLLLTLEAHLEFVADPRTVLVYPGPGEFIARRDFLEQASAALGPAFKFDPHPDDLAIYARKQAWLAEDDQILTAFGYPLTRFYRKED
jgi:hypothetical protein